MALTDDQHRRMNYLYAEHTRLTEQYQTALDNYNTPGGRDRLVALDDQLRAVSQELRDLDFDLMSDQPGYLEWLAQGYDITERFLAECPPPPDGPTSLFARLAQGEATLANTNPDEYRRLMEQRQSRKEEGVRRGWISGDD